MIFIYGLRLVSDLAFYFFFANCIVKSQVVAAIPALLYTVYLIVSKKLETDWDRQSDFFSKSWKLFLVFGAFVCLIGKGQLFVERSIPMAVICLASSILLMRMLRHGSDIYLDKKYQVKNFIVLCGILGITSLLSSKFMLNMVLGSFRFMYNSIVLPILTFIITCLIWIISLFMKLLSWFHLTDVKFEESHLSGSSANNPLADAANGALTQSPAAKLVFSVIGILVLFIGIFFLFRWLLSRREVDHTISRGTLLSKEEFAAKPAERSGSLVNQVRRQYRKYLKLSRMYGVKISKSDTSSSVKDKGEKLFGCSSENSEIREIYIRARYNNQATKSDLRKLKQMYQTIKQKL